MMASAACLNVVLLAFLLCSSPEGARHALQWLSPVARLPRSGQHLFSSVFAVKALVCDYLRKGILRLVSDCLVVLVFPA